MDAGDQPVFISPSHSMVKGFGYTDIAPASSETYDSHILLIGE